jgi:hypothetical protein
MTFQEYNFGDKELKETRWHNMLRFGGKFEGVRDLYLNRSAQLSWDTRPEKLLYRAGDGHGPFRGFFIQGLKKYGHNQGAPQGEFIDEHIDVSLERSVPFTVTNGIRR